MQDWLNENYTEVWVEEVWPPCSPYSNPFDYYLRGVYELSEGQCKVQQQIQGSDPEDQGGDGGHRQGHRGDGLHKLQVQDRGCLHS